MVVFLEEVVSSARVNAFVSALENPSLYESGQRTAGRLAQSHKHNLQALNEKPEVQRIVNQVREDLKTHKAFQRFAIPAKFGRIFVSRYEPGMRYGRHFDDAFIGGVRTDLSFTLFLSEPDTYEGGELELISSAGSQAIKLPAGCALVYASDQLHAVRTVTQGIRLAVVGWIQSRVRSGEQREMLHNFATALDELEAGATDDALTRLKFVRNNLLRAWGSSD